MAASRTLIAHTTTNANINVTVATNGTTVSVGTLDNNVSLVAGDALVLYVADSATGATAGFTPQNASGVVTTIEGDTSGTYQTTAWAPGSSKTDNTKALAGNTIVDSLWSTRVNAATDSGGNHAQVTVVSTKAGTARCWLYLLRPDTGKVIPSRTSRVVSTGNAQDVLTGGGHTDSMTMSATPSLSVDLVLIASGHAAAGSSGINTDADNDTTFEITTNDGAITNSTGVNSQVYDAAGVTGHRPGATVSVKYVANPGSGGHATMATVYQLQAAPIVLTITDNLGFTDTQARNVARQLTENLGLSDVASTGIPIAKSKTDPLGLTDTIKRSVTRALSDNLGLDDSGVLVDKGEILGLTDSIVVLRTGAVTLTKTDQFSLSDAITVTKSGPINLTLTDNLGLADAMLPLNARTSTGNFLTFMGA